MKIKKSRDVKPVEEVPGSIMRKVITPDDGAPNFSMRVIEVKPGSSTAFHSHGWEHEVYILSGEGVVKGEQGESEIARESVVYIAPNEKHCFTNQGKETLRFV